MSLRTQISAYREEQGDGPTHPGIKVAAVALVATGMSIEDAARTCGVSPYSVSKWQKEVGLTEVVPSALEDKRADLGEQLYEYLQKSLRTLIAQLELFGNIKWLEKQRAGELAILHGVIADKATRLLAALRPDDREQFEEDTPETAIIEAEVGG
jgi:hypothetical protein